MGNQSSVAAATSPRRRRLWLLPAALLLALATYHFWDFYLRPTGTGLSVRMVDPDEAQREVGADEKAMVLDVRLHGDGSALARTRRIPRMQLENRIDELEEHKGDPIYVLAATEEDAAETAALLARLNFERVACIRVPPTAHARVGAVGPTVD
ncbi:MAG: hypothetical protein Q8R92_12885 [Deltaproteobacteria bacterium]|nr:hypothetical protein [Deltaproteobacteria bacterium]